jgi:IclR family mhp operon transcriptional activator
MGLPRTTAERILLTLESERFIARDPASKRFGLAARVLALAGGFSAEDRLTQVASPKLFAKTREIGWPLALAVPLGDQMSVRVTTDPATTLWLHKRHVGSEIGIAASSGGIVHLAFLDDAQREEMIEILCQSDDPMQGLARDRPRLDAYLAEARRDGFSIGPDMGAERAVSVPLRDGNGIKAVLVMMYIARGLTMAQITGRFVPELKALAAEIEFEAFGDQTGADTGSKS